MHLSRNNGHLEAQVIFLEYKSDQVTFLRKEPSRPEMAYRAHPQKELPHARHSILMAAPCWRQTSHSSRCHGHSKVCLLCWHTSLWRQKLRPLVIHCIYLWVNTVLELSRCSRNISVSNEPEHPWIPRWPESFKVSHPGWQIWCFAGWRHMCLFTSGYAEPYASRSSALSADAKETHATSGKRHKGSLLFNLALGRN